MAHVGDATWGGDGVGLDLGGRGERTCREKRRLFIIDGN